MDAGAATFRSARLFAPYQIVRARTQTLTCPVYASGALVAPTLAGSTFTMERPDGTALIDAAAVSSVAGSRASYSLAAGDVPDSEALGGQWQVIWSLVFASGNSPEVIRADAILCRRELFPTVTDADIYQRVSSLNPSSATVIHAESTFQDKIDCAWGVLLRQIVNEGRRPDLITTPTALKDAHLLLTLALIFEDFATRLNEAYMAMADRYRSELKTALGSMSYGYDSTDTGRQPASRTKRRGPLMLGGSPLN